MTALLLIFHPCCFLALVWSPEGTLETAALQLDLNLGQSICHFVLLFCFSAWLGAAPFVPVFLHEIFYQEDRKLCLQDLDPDLLLVCCFRRESHCWCCLAGLVFCADLCLLEQLVLSAWAKSHFTYLTVLLDRLQHLDHLDVGSLAQRVCSDSPIAGLDLLVLQLRDAVVVGWRLFFILQTPELFWTT